MAERGLGDSSHPTITAEGSRGSLPPVPPGLPQCRGLKPNPRPWVPCQSDEGAAVIHIERGICDSRSQPVRTIVTCRDAAPRLAVRRGGHRWPCLISGGEDGQVAVPYRCRQRRGWRRWLPAGTPAGASRRTAGRGTGLSDSPAWPPTSLGTSELHLVCSTSRARPQACESIPTLCASVPVLGRQAR